MWRITLKGCRRRDFAVDTRRHFTSSAHTARAHLAAGLQSGQAYAIASVETEHDALSLTWADGHRSRFHFVWLRDHCSSIFDVNTGQRSTSHLHVPCNIAPVQVNIVRARNLGDELLNIEWDEADGTTSVFKAQWLRRACYSDKRRAERLLSRGASRTAWEGASFTPPSVTFAEMMSECDSGGSSDNRVSGMWNAMRELWRYGLLLVHDVPESFADRLPSNVEPCGVPYQDATEALAKQVGFIRRTLYGDMWSFGTFEGTDTGNDSAYSNVALDLHTDGAYMRDPPALQLFTCMFSASDKEGLSRYVDGLRVAERLCEADPAAYDFFRTTPLAYHCQDEGSSLMACGPVFEHGLDGSWLERFRYNDYDRLTLSHLPPQDVLRFYENYRVLSTIITDPQMELQLPLQQGTLAIVHNHRVMHGRTAFAGKRGLCGCYIGDDEFRSTIRQLARQVHGHGQQSADPWIPLLLEGLGTGLPPSHGDDSSVNRSRLAATTRTAV